LLSVRGKNNADGSFNWADALADAGVMAGLTFFTTLSAVVVTGVALTSDWTTFVVPAAISAGMQFFAVLAVKRGLKPKEAE